MVKESYVSFNLAKLLKEKGFNEPCHKTYDITTHDESNFIHCGNHGLISNLISAPTHQLALAWLRENHHFIIVVYPDGKYYRFAYYSNVGDTNNNNVFFFLPCIHEIFKDFGEYDVFGKSWDTFEEATEEGIKFILKNYV